jgi:hypothetical protein
MTLDDLARIEASLGLQLPGDYRALMLRYPFPADSVAEDCALPSDASRVISLA